MLSVETAESLIFQTVLAPDAAIAVEFVSLVEAVDRVLATPVSSELDFPHWDNSAMDGYAVRYDDVVTAQADREVVLEVIEDIPAGGAPQQTLQPGQAARIFTGAMLPLGADTIVMQEHTQRQDRRVTILSVPQQRGEFVRRRGSFYQAGQPLLAAGTRLGAAEIAVLAAVQCTQVPVYRRPKVAILSTGDELVTPEQPLQPGQIVDSNQYALAALVQQSGAEVLRLGIVPDDPDALKVAMETAIAQADMVISSGGVSVGDHDYVDRILEELGATIQIRSIAVKPGKPLTFATLPNKLYFGLPGNPVSALVTFLRFVQPALKKRSGLSTGWQPNFITAKTGGDLKADGKRESYLWGQVTFQAGELCFSAAAGGHNSGNLINLAGCNGLAMIPIGTTAIAAGQNVQVLLMQSIV
ncbi:gephyrin-like molybdotransferase Glp [Alkalinema pantanalense CENA528]|uniref:molybdopterin molybdotransferase MoeA n=1 Tax=Alkalinema pantanalense TaxID=1620705 RepID=UPI003D6E6A56